MDIGLQDPNNGFFYFKRGPSYAVQTTYQWAAGAHYQPFTGDFNADGKTDIGLKDPNNGLFYFRENQPARSFENQSTYQWAAG